MDLRNMRLQEGFLLDKMKVRIGVVGVSPGSGATFVSHNLDYYLNKKEAAGFFVARPEKYIVEDQPLSLSDMDVIVAVLDPLPSNLVEGAESIDCLMDSAVPVLWLVNQDSAGVKHRELYRFLGFRPEFSQEAVPREFLARAEYSVAELPEVYSLKGIEELAERIRKDFRPN